jgi:hypothetical protein
LRSKQEMIDYYQVKDFPIKKCPIFTALKGVLCGYCPLLEDCERGKKHVINYRRYVRRRYGIGKEG